MADIWAGLGKAGRSGGGAHLASGGRAGPLSRRHLIHISETISPHTVSTTQVIAGDLLEDAWKLYRQSFDPLRRLAVQRHVMYADEFDAVMADPRVDKYLAFGEDGSLQGLSTMTADPLAVPLVSPEYFAHRWPDHYRAGRIYYIGFVGVHPDSHGSGVFGEMVRTMTQQIAVVDGLGVLDVCTYNKDRLHLPNAINSLAATWFPHVRMEILDAQTYVSYDFARTGAATG